MDEHGPGGECRRLKQSIVLRPLPAVGIAAICVFLLTSSFHTPNAVQDGPVTEHVIQGVVKSAVVEEEEEDVQHEPPAVAGVASQLRMMRLLSIDFMLDSS